MEIGFLAIVSAGSGFLPATKRPSFLLISNDGRPVKLGLLLLLDNPCFLLFGWRKWKFPFVEMVGDCNMFVWAQHQQARIPSESSRWDPESNCRVPNAEARASSIIVRSPDWLFGEKFDNFQQLLTYACPQGT